ncbi:MAG: Dockerin type domain [Planctomycetota bacterium]
MNAARSIRVHLLRGALAATVAATAILGTHAEVRAQEGADYNSVPRVTVLDPGFFRDRIEQARTGIVRIAMFGDSQETAPWGWGEYYIAHLNARLARIYGPVGESHLFTNHTSIARPYWLATMQESSARTTSAIAESRVPPSMTTQALLAPAAAPKGQSAWAATVLLHDASRVVDPLLASTEWFDQNGPFVADILTVRRPGGGGLAWRNAPTDGDVPDAAAAVLQSGSFAGDAKDAVERFEWRTTPELLLGGRRHLQLLIGGDSAARSSEVVGVRFRSTGAHRGVVLQSFARGGMRLPNLLGEHGDSGEMLRALAPSIAVLHYGANDVGLLPDLATWRAQLIATIAWIRAEMQDPAFPIIIAAEQRTQASVEIMSLADQLPVVAHELATLDDRILALNLRRTTFEAYGWGGTIRYLADAAHFKPYGQRLLAEAFVGELTRALAIPDPACPLPDWADCVRVWGASCQQGGCRMEPDFEAAEHGIPWQGAGTDCSDGDGDGFSDECPPGGREDFNQDGFVDAADLAMLLSAWGTADPLTDLDGDGVVTAADLAAFLGAWGA